MTKKILIVDDEINYVNALARYIQITSNYEVIKKGNAIDAYNELKSNNIDLVISDTEMPGMSGLELKSKLNKENILIPFIGTSGNDDYKQKWLEMDCYFLKKPYHLNKLYEIIKKILEK